MTLVFIVGLAVVQAAPIGSALNEGIELVYESRGVAQAAWVYDSVRVVERQNFARCIAIGRRAQPARESCVRGDTLFERGEANSYRAVRPIGPDMELDVHTAAGDILHYKTEEVGTELVADGLEVASLATTIITRNPSGTVTRRLRERYAPALLTAVWGVFEEPDGSGGWRSVTEFSLIDARPSVAPHSEIETSDSAGYSVEAQRLVGLAHVWGQAKYFHPALTHRSDVDWDAALVAAIPRVRTAQTSSEYGAAVQTMLSALDDPLTRVVMPQTETRTAALDPEFGYRWAEDSILVINAGAYGSLFAPTVSQMVESIHSAYRDAKAVLIDLRSGVPTGPYARFQLTYAFSGLERLLTAEPLQTPGDWYRVYTGYESGGQFSSGQYQTGVFIRRGQRVTPSSGSRGVPIVFLLNEHAGVLATTVPLQAAGHARIVLDGTSGRHSIGETVEIALPEGVTVQVRRSESVFADGTSAAFRPDVIIPGSPARTGDPALDRALEIARAFEPSRVNRERLPAAIAPQPDRSYPEMRYPSLEYRLLAAFRIWNTVLHFYPYKDLLDHDWETALEQHLPSFILAQNAAEYTRAVAVMVERMQDSHAYLAGTLVTDEMLGTGYPPIRVRMIEDVPTVTALYAGVQDGIEVGDIVVAVDGVPAADRLAETARLLAASTPWSRMDRTALTFMNGPPGSTVTLTVSDATNLERDVVLERRHEDFTTLYHRERQGEVMRILPGNVGYVDLDRLALADVDRMFTLMAGTAGIIFDMRGYPQGTIWRIAPWLARETRAVARFETPLVGYPAPEPGSLAFVQTVEPAISGQVGYRGPTLMLIDERTMSQAEHAGLYLKAANGTRFVGSRTAGANGEITTFSLPGGITVGFTGQAVRHPDGRQLQRVGLIPDIEVSPTIGGIRAGVDEVLDEALRHMRRQP